MRLFAMLALSIAACDPAGPSVPTYEVVFSAADSADAGVPEAAATRIPDAGVRAGHDGAVPGTGMMRGLPPPDMAACRAPELLPDPTLPDAGANRTQLENARMGDSSWVLAQPSRARNRDVEGYASATSAAPGDVVPIHVSTAVATQVRLEVYRVGHYGGAGARRVASLGPFAAGPQPAPQPDPITHLVACAWPVTASVTVGGDWPDGIYLIKLHAQTGYESYVPLIVRDGRAADVLFVASTTSWQAYNFWGGWSLYGHPDGATYSPTHPEATRVSFDRPYGTLLAGDAFYDSQGAGAFLKWDVYTVRWLEWQGYDVSYTDDVDVHLHKIPSGQRTVVIGAHDEYWSSAMRDAFIAARDSGTSLAFLGANEGFWKVRIERAPMGTAPGRVVTCWKDTPGDPLSGTPDGTDVTWRNAGNPEQSLVGQMYDEQTGNLEPAGLTVAAPGHWLLDGTGLTPNCSVPGVVGYEFDRVVPGFAMPPGLEVIAASPTPFGVCGHVTLYFAASGAQVFSAGSIGWAWALAKPGTSDVRIARITRNLLDNMIHPTHGATAWAQGVPDCPVP